MGKNLVISQCLAIQTSGDRPETEELTALCISYSGCIDRKNVCGWLSHIGHIADITRDLFW
jgi:hypothetical protein